MTKLNPQVFDDIITRLSGALPQSLQAAKTDIETNFRAILQAGLTKLDLVSREEFDVQTQVLLRTREKLTALETRINQLEAQLAKE